MWARDMWDSILQLLHTVNRDGVLLSCKGLHTAQAGVLLSVDCAAGTCSPGFYVVDQSCQACPAGSYCAGGAAPPVACGPGLKHIIATAQEAEQCGEQTRIQTAVVTCHHREQPHACM